MATLQTTTTRLRLSARDRVRAFLTQRDPLVLIAAACLPIIALLIIGTAIRATLRTPAAAAVPTPQLPIVLIATARAEQLPTPAAQPVAYQAVAQRWVTAFAAPGGDVLGPIVAPDLAALTGRWGDDWLSTTHEGATVWIRAADLGVNLADVRPMPSLPIAPVVSAPAPAPAYQVDSQPAQPTLTAAERHAALEREFGDVTGADRQQALDAHTAQQRAWCATQQSAYCDLLRAAQP